MTCEPSRYAQQETRSVSAFFPEHRLVLNGSHATESPFKQQAGGYEIIHLASHGIFDKINPIFSGVQLEPDTGEDGRLEVYEILRLRLKAHLVTLSAWETAFGSGYFAEFPAGDDFVGLTRAFLICAAGSLCLLMLAWATLLEPTFAQNIQVTSANPASARQGTVNLNVFVGGSGFKKGDRGDFRWAALVSRRSGFAAHYGGI